MGRLRVVGVGLSAAVFIAAVSAASPAFANYVTISIDTPITNGSEPLIIHVATDADGDAIMRCDIYRGGKNDGTPEYSVEKCRGDVALDVTSYPSNVYLIRATSHHPGKHDSVGGSTKFWIDRQAPHIDLTVAAKFVLGVPWANWKATNEIAGTTRYESQIRWGDQNSRLGPWQDLAKTKKLRKVIEMRDGTTACFRVRGTDSLDNQSEWTDPKCMVRPLDDRALSGWKKKSNWKKISQPNLFKGTGLVAAAPGSKLTLAKAAFDTLVIWGRQGPYSGTLKIKLGKKVLDTVNLHAHDSKGVVIFRHNFAKTKTGTIVLTVTSAGKPITLDAIAVTRG